MTMNTEPHVFWLPDPEAAPGISSPFVRQPRYHDLQTEVEALRETINAMFESRAKALSIDRLLAFGHLGAAEHMREFYAMTVYVFLVKRPIDSEAWPCVYRDPDLAEKAFGRISAVVAVEIETTVKPNAD
jgi:hypothetical protein